MICIGKNLYISVISVTNPKNVIVFAFTYVIESFVLLYGDFCMNPYSVDSDEAMKRGDEAFNASLLQFLRSVKRFIATIFYSALNPSLPLLFKENHCLTLSSPLLF
jgi:hypothetical protein